jgi:hypothetical protein
MFYYDRKTNNLDLSWDILKFMTQSIYVLVFYLKVCKGFSTMVS